MSTLVYQLRLKHQICQLCKIRQITSNTSRSANNWNFKRNLRQVYLHKFRKIHFIREIRLL